jgi:SAM-dependent methyltransferase
MSPGALRDVDLRDIGFDGPDRVWEHIPSPWGVLGRILRAGEIASDEVFIDIGCGMGPVLVEAAARYPFRRVIGIDVVPQFTEVARQMIARGRQRLRCRAIEITTADVLEYDIPDDVTVAFMADPFRGRLFDAVIAKLIASVDRNPRRLRIIYSWPVEGGRLERSGQARLVRYGHRWGRPWTTTPELAMYEIEPSSDGGRSSARRSREFSRGLRERFLAYRPSTGPSSGGGDRGDPTIQIRSGVSSRGWTVVATESGPGLEPLRKAFSRQHCVRLPRLLDARLLERIQRYVSEGEFSAPRYEGTWDELRMEEGGASQLLMLLLNDPGLFEHVREITACRRIGRVDGGVYRMLPGGEDEPWHGEIFGHRMVEMSVDLSNRPYAGGALEIRNRYSQRILHRALETEPGDAVLVRLAPFLQHRVTAIAGDTPRTVYAGHLTLFKPGASSALARPGSRR